MTWRLRDALRMYSDTPEYAPPPRHGLWWGIWWVAGVPVLMWWVVWMWWL